MGEYEYILVEFEDDDVDEDVLSSPSTMAIYSGSRGDIYGNLAIIEVCVYLLLASSKMMISDITGGRT